MALQETYKRIKRWSSLKPPIKRLATQDQLSGMEIRFYNCIIVYKLKHIETQACKYKRRRVAKNLGYSFRSLRQSFRESDDDMFEACIFNPSDRHILREHILNLESVKIRFSNCRFLRRDNKLSEKFHRYWRNYYGKIVNFSLIPGQFQVNSQTIRLKDLPTAIEFIIEKTKIEDIQQ